MIKLKKVSKRFFNRLLYDNVNIEIPLNQLSFIVGQSGSGKTTLINMLGGLEKVDSGLITLETESGEINLQNNKDSNLIDFVFQDYNLFPTMNTLNNLKVGSKVIGSSWSKQDSIQKLKEFDFDDSAIKSKTSELSGGEQQRLSILRALERDSKILLIDEPTGNLDEKNAQNIFEMLKKISKSKTVIVVSHDIDSAEKYADNIFKIENSSIIQTKKSDLVSQKFNVSDKPKKSKMFWKKASIAPTVALNDFKKHKISFILMFLSIFLILFSGVLLQFNFGEGWYFRTSVFSVNKSKLKELNLDTGQIRGRTYYKGNNIPKFIGDDNKKISEIPGILQIVDEKAKPTNPKLFVDNKEITLDEKHKFVYEDILNNKFFEQRLKDNGLEGSFLKDPNDIILGKSFADKIGGSNIIGKNVVVDLGIDGLKPQTLKVVGINTNHDYDNNYISYLNHDLLNQPREKRDYVLFNKHTYIIFGTPISGTKLSDNDPLLKQALPVAIDGTEKIITGKNDNDINSLLISSELLKMLNAKNIEAKIDDMFDINYYKDIGTSLKLSGIFESNIPQIRLNEKTINELTNPGIVSKRFYIDTNNYKKISKALENISMDKKSSGSLSDTFQLRKFLEDKVPKNILIGIAFSIAFFAGMLLGLIGVITFSIMLVKLKKQDIKILKVLGAKLWQIIFYNISSFAMIVLFVLLGIIISTIIATPIYYNMVVTSPYVSVQYDVLITIILVPWLIISGIGLIIFTIGSSITSRLSYKKLKS